MEQAFIFEKNDNELMLKIGDLGQYEDEGLYLEFMPLLSFFVVEGNFKDKS